MITSMSHNIIFQASFSSKPNEYEKCVLPKRVISPPNINCEANIDY